MKQGLEVSRSAHFHKFGTASGAVCKVRAFTKLLSFAFFLRTVHEPLVHYWF